MVKRIVRAGLVLAFLTAEAVVLAGPPLPARQPDQDKKSRPEFYVARVVSSEGVKDPDEVLGKPDGRCAEIAPGGRMTLLMEKPILPSSGFDDGHVICRGEADYGLEGWVVAGQSKEAPERAWMPLAAGVSPGGFRLSSQSYERSPEGSPGVTLIRISNNGSKPLYLDAVVGYGRQPQARLAP